MQEKIDKLIEILGEVDAEAREAAKPGQECLPRYWQGKKDGIRLALIVLDLMGENNDPDIIRQQRTSVSSRYTATEDQEVFTIRG